ncbi:Uncharacterized protein PRO82_001146 [Candidatus Protochlamydia amoebophila]|nr:Uncharacterized protein [Candidatus Protochlamydia amoebophila]
MMPKVCKKKLYITVSMTRVNYFNLIFKLRISIFYLQFVLVKISPLVQNRFDLQSKFIIQFCFKKTSLEKHFYVQCYY